jgi:polar amino acid transport system substrate-binding protein
MRLICDDLGLSLRPVPYSGDDFDRIFDALGNKSYDAVISGTTITPERERVALFSAPYLQFDQGRKRETQSAGKILGRPARPGGGYTGRQYL